MCTWAIAHAGCCSVRSCVLYSALIMSLSSWSWSPSVRDGVGDTGESRTGTDTATGSELKARGGDEVCEILSAVNHRELHIESKRVSAFCMRF